MSELSNKVFNEYEMNNEELIYKNLEKKINEAFGNGVFITFDEMNRLGKCLDSRDIKKIYDNYLKQFERWKESSIGMHKMSVKKSRIILPFHE